MDDKKSIGLAVVSEISGRPAGELQPSQNLVGDLGIDSPKALQLLLLLEERLDIEISDEDAAQMDTVGDILDYLGARA
ncbi:MAG: acyl carrier protein [Holophagales bacterium]|nr:acyl carrier protein [Holophagales bacterium]